MRNRETGSISPVSRPINYKGEYASGTVYFPNDLVGRAGFYWLYIYPIPTEAPSPTTEGADDDNHWIKIGSSQNPNFVLEGIDISIEDIVGLEAANVQEALEELRALTIEPDPVLIASNDTLGTVQVGDGLLPNPITGNIELLKSPYLDERSATGPKNIFYVSTNGYDHPDAADNYKVAANLVKINRTNIINAAFNAITVPLALASEATTNKCKRDIGFFVDAIIADLGNSTSAPAGFLSNLYATQAAKAYYTLEGVRNISASEITPTKEAFAKVATEVIIKVGNQFASFVNALTSLVNGYLENGLNWSDAPPLNIGVQRGRYIDGGNLILANKTHIIDSVLDKLQSPPNNYTIPAGDKCRRDLEFIIEAVVKDLQNLSNTFSITIGRNYYGSEGLVISDSGNPSEKQKTITAFIETRHLCMDAIQNKLSNTSDYDSVSGDLNPALFLPNALQHEESECATVASAAHVLFSIVIGYIQNGLGWANAPKQNPGLTRKPLPGQTVETAYKTIKRALEEVKKFPGKECTVRVGSGKFYENNPLEIPQPKTAVVGDNLRTTTVIPLNHGQDLFKLDSGTYLNYMVFEDNYLGGFGILKTSTFDEPERKALPEGVTALELFPGHTIKDTPVEFKEAATVVADDSGGSARNNLITLVQNSYTNYAVVSILTAIEKDLKIFGNKHSVEIEPPVYSEAALNLIKSELRTKVLASKTEAVKKFVDDLMDIIIQIAEDPNSPKPQINTGTLLLIDQEWLQISSISNNNTVNFTTPTNSTHISGAKCTQNAKAFRYAAAFKDGVNIFLSPYIQNCSNISVLGHTELRNDNSEELDEHKTLAGGILVDGNVLAPTSPIASMVMDAFTQIVSGSVGFHHKNDGYSQLVSVFQVFEDVGILCESGAYCSVTNSATNFGNYGLKAVGFSKQAYPFFKGTITSAYNEELDTTNTVPAEIIGSSFKGINNNSQTEVTLTINVNQINQFSVGQKISVEGHGLNTPAAIANGSNLEITKTSISPAEITYVVGNAYSNNNPISSGGITGSASITQGKFVTRIDINGFKSQPLPNYIIKIENQPGSGTFYDRLDKIQYIVEETTPLTNINQTTKTGECTITLQILWDSAEVGNVSLNDLINKNIELRRPSTVNSSSHTFEFIGSGINYTALPENGGRTDPQTQTVEVNSGKVYCSATDQDGNFTVGPFFNVDLKSGAVTFTGTVSLGVIDEIQLKNSPGVPIRQFSIDRTLGGNLTQARHTTIPTQKAIYEFADDNLGSLFKHIPTTTSVAKDNNSSVPGYLVMLNSDGKISADQLPARSPFTVIPVDSDEERTSLISEETATNPEDIQVRPGDFVIVNIEGEPPITYVYTGGLTSDETNWTALTSTAISAESITSGLIDPARLGTGIGSDKVFASGNKQLLPVVRSIQVSSGQLTTGSPLEVTSVGNSNLLPGSYPSNSFVGDVTITLNTVSFDVGATSSSLGVAKFAKSDFDIVNGEVSIADKAVDLNEITHISARSVLGNDSSGSGVVRELPLDNLVATVLAIDFNFNGSTYDVSFLNNISLGSNPNLTLTKGQTYKFNISGTGHSFNLTTTPVGAVGPSKLYNRGLRGTSTNGIAQTNDATPFIWTVPLDAPNILFYQDGNSLNNFGVISLVGGFVSVSKIPKTVLTLQDNGTIVEIDATSDTNIGLPNNLPVGFNVIVVQKGTGRITFSPATGSTMRNSRNHTGTADQYSSVTLYVSSNNQTNNGAEYILSGDTL